MTTPRTTIQRPEPEEYSPYFGRYVASIPDGDLLSLLQSQLGEWDRLVAAIGEARTAEPYAPGKWSVRDTILHLADTERVMAYRALRAARGDATPLAPFEQDDYVRAAGANERSSRDLLDELAAVRGATIALLRGLDAGSLERRGLASGATVTARAMAYIIAGHELSHLRLLAEHLTATSEG